MLRSVLAVAIAALFCAQCRTPGPTGGLRSADAPDPEGAVRLTLLGLNDVHGTIDPRDVTLGNTATAKVKARVGGLDALGAYLDVARAANPGATLVLDAGDMYQGTLLSNSSWGLPVAQAYNALQIDAATFGNHEFDFGAGEVPGSGPQGALRRLLQAATFPYLSANVRPVARADALPNTVPSTMFTRGGIKIGVIGATTPTTPQQTKAANVVGLQFQPLADAVPAEARKLRAEGAQLVILVTHAGGYCDMTRPAEQGDQACATPVADEITAFLAAVPAGTVDVVFAGHQHLPQAHLIRGVPVLQTSGYASSLSMVDVWVRPDARPMAPPAARIAKIAVHKPTYLCYRHYAAYASCNPDEAQQKGAYPADFGAETAPTFLGREVAIDPARLDPVLSPYRQKVKDLSAVKVADFPVALPQDRTRESPASNCVVDALKEAIAAKTGKKVDVAVMGSGGIRGPFPSGQARFADVFAVLPFDNDAALATLTGAELDLFGRTLSMTAKNIGVISDGWTIRLAKTPVTPRHRGFLAPGGAPLPADALYTVVTVDFHTLPGAETIQAFTKANAEGRVELLPYTLRDAVIERLSRTDVPLPPACRGSGKERAAFVDD